MTAQLSRAMTEGATESYRRAGEQGLKLFRESEKASRGGRCLNRVRETE